MSDNQFLEERNKELKELFDIYDVDKDGKLNKKDFNIVLRSLGFDQLPINDEQDEGDFEQMYSLNDFTNYINSLGNDTNIESELYKIFLRFDYDGSGRIMVSDFNKVMSVIGQRFSEEEIDDLVKELDKNETGYIRLEGLLHVMANKLFV